MLPHSRVAAAEYAKRRVLAETTETRFGTFVHDADHADRAAATAFVDVVLPDESPIDPADDREARRFLDRARSAYDRVGLDHRVFAGYDDETFARLAPLLRERGYDHEVYWALVAHLVDAPAGSNGLDIDARKHGSDDALAVHESVGRDRGAIAYAAEVARALDGRELVAFRDGEPVGVAGWYVHESDDDGGDDPVARLTHVGVRPDAQGEGIGSELVRAVVDRCPLPGERTVVCATAEHVEFYESLGFTRNDTLWRFVRLP
jgi:GNAT superfamily N-acetyltransferase